MTVPQLSSKGRCNPARLSMPEREAKLASKQDTCLHCLTLPDASQQWQYSVLEVHFCISLHWGG